MNWRKITAAVLLWVFLFWSSVPVMAEQLNQWSGNSGGSAAEYVIGQENELKININIWGKVRSPGLYRVPSNTNLLQLISYAGGPSDKALISKIKLVRSTKEEKRIIIVDIKKYLETGDEGLIPNLEPNDTIVVSGGAFNIFSEIVTVFAQLAIIGNVYYLFSKN